MTSIKVFFLFTSCINNIGAWTITSWVGPRINLTRRHGVEGNAKPFSGPGVEPPRNVLGGELECCCSDVGGSGIATGFYRDGFCSTGAGDTGRHTVCVEVTAEFLAFSKAVGNDLSTPMPEYQFPGLKPGDKWCLCAQRWAQAYNEGKAPKLFLRATHERTLKIAPLDVLKVFAKDLAEVAEDVELDQMRQSLNERLAKSKLKPTPPARE